jgi:hypothetical protein
MRNYVRMRKDLLFSSRPKLRDGTVMSRLNVCVGVVDTSSSSIRACSLVFRSRLSLPRVMDKYGLEELTKRALMMFSFIDQVIPS